jgi:mannose-6-phosphate isomerase-like protein (cupin superfamily)
MPSKIRLISTVLAGCGVAWLSAPQLASQAPAPGQAGPGGRGGPPQQYWVQKTKGGVYLPPNKPLTKLADLKAKYKGRPAWNEVVLKDTELQAEYHSAPAGTKQSPRFHPCTVSVLVVFEGEMQWQVENQEAFTAKRGSIVNLPPFTMFSFEVIGSTAATWIEVNPVHYDTVYPVESPAPAAAPGAVLTKIAFNRRPAPYAAPNKPHWNLHDSVKANPERPGGVQVLTDHMYANANYGFADPNDPANPNRGNPDAGRGGRGGRGGQAADSGPWDPKMPFGHLHAGSAEWWIVLVGHISGKFETGEVIGAEGDVLYAPPYTWHQMANYGPGASCRLTFGAYDPVNFGVVRD